MGVGEHKTNEGNVWLGPNESRASLSPSPLSHSPEATIHLYTLHLFLSAPGTHLHIGTRQKGVLGGRERGKTSEGERK